MATTTITRALRTLVAAGTSNAAAATTYGATDCRTILGGKLTMKVINGAVSPTVACQVAVLVSHVTGATPATGGSGANWKRVAVYTGGTAANGVYEFDYTYSGGMHLEVEFSGNTGQAVTVEALFAEDTNAQTV